MSDNEDQQVAAAVEVQEEEQKVDNVTDAIKSVI